MPLIPSSSGILLELNLKILDMPTFVKYKDTIYFDKTHLANFYRKNMTTPSGTLPNYWLGIPLKMNDEILGVLYIDDEDKNDISYDLNISILQQDLDEM